MRFNQIKYNYLLVNHQKINSQLKQIIKKVNKNVYYLKHIPTKYLCHIIKNEHIFFYIKQNNFEFSFYKNIQTTKIKKPIL